MEKFAEVYNKYAEKMELAKAMCEAAMKRNDKEAARKYRAEYLEYKSVIDMYAIPLIMK